MKLVEVSNLELDSYLLSQKQSQFLQSYEWGEFQKATGSGFFCYGLFEKDKLLLAFSVFEKKIFRLGSYFYSPRLNIGHLSATQLDFLLKELSKIASAKGVIFWRIEPLKEIKGELPFKIKKTIDVQPSKTSILDISLDESQILERMHQKTRYNIRLADRKGVLVRMGGEKDFEKFWELLLETKKRDGFRLHAKEYYQKMLSLQNIELIVAEYEGEMVSANLVSFFGDMAIYLHGASGSKHRNAMAPFAIQWRTIFVARGRQCLYYDLNGIDDKKWPGVSRYKNGFGGIETNYPGAFDVVFSYWLFQFYLFIRKARRLISRIVKI